jgi:hypothetical protein
VLALVLGLDPCRSVSGRALMKSFRLALAQIETHLGDVAANLDAP